MNDTDITTAEEMVGALCAARTRMAELETDARDLIAKLRKRADALELALRPEAPVAQPIPTKPTKAKPGEVEGPVKAWLDRESAIGGATAASANPDHIVKDNPGLNRESVRAVLRRMAKASAEANGHTNGAASAA